MSKKCQSLYAAILVRAIRDLSDKDKHLRLQARRWLFGESECIEYFINAGFSEKIALTALSKLEKDPMYRSSFIDSLVRDSRYDSDFYDD